MSLNLSWAGGWPRLSGAPTRLFPSVVFEVLLLLFRALVQAHNSFFWWALKIFLILALLRAF